MKCLWIILSIVAVTVAKRSTAPDFITPSGKKWPNPVVTLRTGASDTYDCAAKGTPQPTYKWFLNGTEITDRSRDVMRVNAKTGRLTITDKFNRNWSGMFQCVATNENGASMTPYLHILSTVIGIFDGEVSTVDKMISPSLYKKLTCDNVPFSIPPFIIKWGTSKEVINPITNEREFENVKDIVDGERMIIDSDGTLHILWVDAAKDIDKSFRCVGDNDIMALKSTKVYKLKIQPGLENFRKPELKYNKDVVVMEGRDAVLECVYTYFKTNPSEHFDVTWLYQGNEVGLRTDKSIYEKQNKNPGILKVKNVQIPNGKNINVEGEYLCLATLGSHEAQGNVHLKVVAPPQFIPNRGLSSLSAPKSTDAVFSCFTYSHNAYEDPVTWFMNGKPILGCPMGMFECQSPNSDGSPQCIPLKRKGDSYPDCIGISEETSSIFCNENQKVCNKKCIAKGAKCEKSCACYIECSRVSSSCGLDVCDISDACQFGTAYSILRLAASVMLKTQGHNKKTSLKHHVPSNLEKVCLYPDYKCSDSKCLIAAQICNGFNDCSDAVDEQYCPDLPPLHVGPNNRLIVTSNRRELTVPNILWDDSMCLQCMVKNDYGVLFGDGCLTVIDNIEATLLPNETYIVGPGDILNIGVDATTDPLYQNQMKYGWIVYDKEDDSIAYNIGHSMFKDQFGISITGKNLTINFPDIVGDDDPKVFWYKVYGGMTGAKYALNISHRYDEFIFNFTVEGKVIVKPTPTLVIQPSTNLWFIAVILAIIVLFVIIALIICYMHRNRGGTYLVHKKEHQAGHDIEQELKDSGFQEVGRVDDYDDDEKTRLDEVSLTESVKPYESDEDITEEYGGDFEFSKFNEDGSFIGLYGDKKNKSSNIKEAAV